METVCFFIGWAELVGKDICNALVVTNVDVSMKKIRSKNTISGIEDMLKFGLILFWDFNDISYVFDHKLNLKILLRHYH